MRFFDERLFLISHDTVMFYYLYFSNNLISFYIMFSLVVNFQLLKKQQKNFIITKTRLFYYLEH